MAKLNKDKLSMLKTSSEHLDEKYGPKGTPGREAFEAKASAYYYAELLKEQRKAQKMTQQELAENVGVKKSYISRIESGGVEPSAGLFLSIINSLGLSIVRPV